MYIGYSDVQTSRSEDRHERFRILTTVITTTKSEIKKSRVEFSLAIAILGTSYEVSFEKALFAAELIVGPF